MSEFTIKFTAEDQLFVAEGPLEADLFHSSVINIVPSSPTTLNLSDLGISSIRAIFFDSEVPITVEVKNGSVVLQTFTGILSSFTLLEMEEVNDLQLIISSAAVASKVRITLLGGA